MTYFQCITTHTARIPHRCVYCLSTITSGETYVKLAGRWQDDFYLGKGHQDCRELWDSLFWSWADDHEGMAWDICEVFTESGEILATQEALNTRRGLFPHAVNRIEFRLRHWLTFDKEEDVEGRFYG